jgi:elongation factor P
LSPLMCRRDVGHKPEKSELSTGQARGLNHTCLGMSLFNCLETDKLSREQDAAAMAVFPLCLLSRSLVDRSEGHLLYCLPAPAAVFSRCVCLSRASLVLAGWSFRCVASQSRTSEFEHKYFRRSCSGRIGTLDMSSIKATLLRPGMVIQHEGDLYSVFSTEHRTPGNKRGSMQTRMKNLRTGAIIDYRFRAEEFVDRAILDEIEFEYLYSEGDEFHFMNTENYEQMQMTRAELGETVYYLIPNTLVKVEFFQDKPIGIDLPDTMDLKVVQTEPTLQKATASAVMKPATLETGLVVNVPPFVNQGDKIRVDTSEARYVQRVES